MKAKRLCVIGLGLGGLALLFTLARWLPSGEPVYQGKTVSAWFKEYAFASNAPAPAVLSFRPDGRNLIVQTTSGIRTIPLPSFTNRTEQILWIQRQTMWRSTPAPDPAWLALAALGSNAVPQLVQHLHLGRFHRPYERAFKNLSPLLQRKLPNPAQKRWYRIQAIRAIAKLGDPARGASPALLGLLKEPDPSLRREVATALTEIHADRRAITEVLLQLGAQQRYAEVTCIAFETGWEGDEMAGLLGRILQARDPALRQAAIRLLEGSGTAARPALIQIIRALGDSDKEVRYLAARAVEANAMNTPQVVDALRASLNDENVMVRNVTRRTLLKIAPNTLPTAPIQEGGEN